jgi:hypothetical protein
MENDAVPVLRMGENTPPTRHLCMSGVSAQISLSAAATAITVTAKLTHGPQSIAPAITAIAKSGKNDLPSTCLAFERKPSDGRPMLRSFPLRFSWRS